MKTWTDVQLGLARTRMRKLEAEAAVERFAAMRSQGGRSSGLRAGVGRALIRAGHALAPEATAAHHHHRRMAARQP